jgi:hypothetical protein
MSESPGGWGEYGFMGGVALGAVLAYRIIHGWFKPHSDETPQKRVTPADVLEAIRAIDLKLALLESRFEGFRTEEARAHMAIESQLRNALNNRRNES